MFRDGVKADALLADVMAGVSADVAVDVAVVDVAAVDVAAARLHACTKGRHV